MIRKILSWVLTFILLGGMIAVLSFGTRQQHNRRISDVKITIRYQGAEPLLTNTVIRGHIAQLYDTLGGRPIESVDIEWIQKEIEQISAVRSAGVQIRPDGSVEVRVNQRKPLIRVINSAQTQYCIADDGTLIYDLRLLQAALPVLSGKIGEGIALSGLDGLRCDTFPASHILQEAYLIGKAFEANPFMNSLSEQIYRNEQGEYEIVPLIGPDIVLLGGIDDLKSKFIKISLFYKKTYGHIDWSKYSTLDVRFANQVICIKKDK